jgi:allophanate hydrolase subunit 1
MPTSSPLRRTQRTPQGSIRLAPFGGSAITVEFGDEIDPRVNACVVAFAATVSQQGWKGILEIVPTYRAVTIYFDALHGNVSELADRLKRLPRLRSEGI